jgi:hypothetical protein
MPVSRSQIERVLEAEVRAARYRFRATMEEFQKAIEQLPGRARFPGDYFRVQMAAEKRRAATRLFRLSLIRFSNFLLKGEIPPDIDDSRNASPRARRGGAWQLPYVEF